MYDAESLRRIASYLALGSTIRETARHMHVSRGLVQRVAQGKLTPSERETITTHANNAERVYGRCPTCGTKGIIPCLACALGKVRDAQHALAEANAQLDATIDANAPSPNENQGPQQQLRPSEDEHDVSRPPSCKR